MNLSSPAPPLRLVAVGIGSGATPEALEPAVRRLAGALGLPVVPVADPLAPDPSLTALRQAAAGWLAPLPVDPGLCLPAGGSWAEALGAWRQACLLVIGADQVATGLPAAGTALLRQWQVPLLGVLQAGGAWEPQRRRREGLPWLGDPEDIDRAAAVLRLRGVELDLPAG
jgi:hypothetical protein